MEEEDRENQVILKQRPPSSPSHSLEENGIEERIASSPGSVIQIQTNDDLLKLFLAYSKKLQTGPAGPHKRFFEALSALEMDLGPTNPSRFQKYGPPIGALMISTGAALALGELFMFDGGVGILLGATPGKIYSGLPPTPALIAGVVAGSLVFVTAPLQMTECLTHLTNASSKYKAKAEPEQSFPKRVVLKLLIGGTCVVLSLKSIFAFVQTNIHQGLDSTVFSAIIGPFFGVYKLLSAHHVAQEKWTLIYQWCGEKIDRFRGKIRPGEEERNFLRRGFANSFRKLILDKADGGDETEELFDAVHALHGAGKQQLKLWDQGIKDLQKKLSKASPTDRGTLQSSIDALKKSRDAFQRVLTLAILKMLFDFDKEESSFPEHLRDPKWYGSHPWWYRAAQGTGVVFGGLSTCAIWYSWKYVLNIFVGTYFEHHPETADKGYTPYILPNGVSDTFATTLTLFCGPYLTSSSVSVCESLVCSMMGYNPAENHPYIENPNITYPRARGVATFLNWCSHTFQEIPAALVGGSGMGWAGIPLAQQWWTLGPYMAAMGAGGHVLSGEVLQKNITKLMNRFDKSKGGIDAKRQFLAYLLKASDDWLKTLRREYVMDLKDLLEKDFDDLFTIDEEEETAVFEDDGERADSSSDDSSGDSGFFRGENDDDRMRQPGQGEGLTAPLLEHHTPPRRSPSGIRGWFERHLTKPLRSIFSKKNSPDFEMLPVHEV